MTQENDELIMVGGDSIRQSEIEEEPDIPFGENGLFHDEEKAELDEAMEHAEMVESIIASHGHGHSFILDVARGGSQTTIQAICKCGRVLSYTEIETVLNLNAD